MNKIDLKNRLELLYCNSLESNDYTYFAAIDAVKSIYGINYWFVIVSCTFILSF